MSFDYVCPRCGSLVFSEPPGSSAICPCCGWEGDGIQLTDSHDAGGANGIALRGLARHGIYALMVAVASLVLLRGFDLRMLLLFGLPPAVAALHTGMNFARATRILAWAFLGAIALGSFVAHVPSLFPNLKGMDPNLNPQQDRLLVWYCGVYVIWFLIVPVRFFLSNLYQHRLGEPAGLSRFTCYLGLTTAALCSVGLPRFLGLLGFWPVL